MDCLSDAGSDVDEPLQVGQSKKKKGKLTNQQKRDKMDGCVWKFVNACPPSSTSFLPSCRRVAALKLFSEVPRPVAGRVCCDICSPASALPSDYVLEWATDLGTRTAASITRPYLKSIRDGLIKWESGAARSYYSNAVFPGVPGSLLPSYVVNHLAKAYGVEDAPPDFSHSRIQGLCVGVDFTVSSKLCDMLAPQLSTLRKVAESIKAQRLQELATEREGRERERQEERQRQRLRREEASSSRERDCFAASQEVRSASAPDPRIVAFTASSACSVLARTPSPVSPTSSVVTGSKRRRGKAKAPPLPAPGLSASAQPPPPAAVPSPTAVGSRKGKSAASSPVVARASPVRRFGTELDPNRRGSRAPTPVSPASSEAAQSPITAETSRGRKRVVNGVHWRHRLG
ncbi:unnamed protein product [Zymoseptoria tritici ST99CH_1A5]|uniref:Uncharacterized protein n=1 Tax=Zymoseptoria tritici ST99CH_1A5 TaxID=1276529 RepID=A0A1Y6L664_ZYMTR|nr:unnamed protein product [Zymoseptoria tritici ST99CH_1A5]